MKLKGETGRTAFSINLVEEWSIPVIHVLPSEIKRAIIVFYAGQDVPPAGIDGLRNGPRGLGLNISLKRREA